MEVLVDEFFGDVFVRVCFCWIGNWMLLGVVCIVSIMGWLLSGKVVNMVNNVLFGDFGVSNGVDILVI